MQNSKESIDWLLEIRKALQKFAGGKINIQNQSSLYTSL